MGIKIICYLLIYLPLVFLGLTSNVGHSAEAKKTKTSAQSKKKKSKKRASKSKKARSMARSSRQIKIVYGASSWNKSSGSLDSAYLYVKDKKTDNLAKVILEETEPDSSTFSGNFALAWDESDSLRPEVYIPPQKFRGKAAQEAYNRRLTAGTLNPSPFAFKKNAEGHRVMDVYDTKEQAQAAKEAFENAKKIEEEIKKKQKALLAKPIPSKIDLEVAALAEKADLIDKLAIAAAKRETERIRLEQLERQKAEELKRRQAALAASARKRQKEKAKSLAEEALKAYQNGKFNKAEKLFKKSIELDPSNTDYYFKYGVSLYRNKKYDEALVILRIAKVKGKVKIEKYYYLGLIHYRLKEVDQALKLLKRVRKSGHPIFSPSAAFYRGIILYTIEKYEKAKAPFEYVLDHSKDPRMDEKAESYLEKIAGQLRFKAEAAKKLILNMLVGLTYDSNILFAPDNNSDQGTASDKGGGRTMLGVDGEYRFYYDRSQELSAKLGTLYMYSFSEEFTRADPWVNTVSIPYSRKGLWQKKGYKLVLTPSYEVLNMNVDTVGAPENILNSVSGKADLTLIMRSDYFANYTFEMRNEASRLADSTGDDDLSAIRFNLRTDQSYFLDKSKKTAVIWNAGFSLNNAFGKNKQFQKIELGATYRAPVNKWKNASWTGGLTAYHLQYPSASVKRKDQNVGLTLGFSRVVKKWVTLGANLTYNVNGSDIDANSYSRYSAMTTAAFNWSTSED